MLALLGLALAAAKKGKKAKASGPAAARKPVPKRASASTRRQAA